MAAYEDGSPKGSKTQKQAIRDAYKRKGGGKIKRTSNDLNANAPF